MSACKACGAESADHRFCVKCELTGDGLRKELTDYRKVLQQIAEEGCGSGLGQPMAARFSKLAADVLTRW